MAEATAGDGGGGFKGMMGNLSKFFVPKDSPTTPPVVSPPSSGQPGNGNGNNVQQTAVPKMNADGTPALDASGKLVYEAPSNSPAAMKSPMDAYAKLFEPTSIDPKAPKSPSFTLSPDVIAKAAGGMDFTADLPAELAEALQAGTLDSKTMLSLVNHVGRQSYARAMEHASTLTNKFVGMKTEFERTQELPKALQNILARSEVSQLPNVKDNPVLKSHVEFIASQFSDKYPDMTPAEISQATSKYFKDVATMMDPSLQTGGRRVNGKDDLEFDFEAYLKS